MKMNRLGTTWKVGLCVALAAITLPALAQQHAGTLYQPGKSELISPAAQKAGELAPIEPDVYGDPNNLLYPLNVGTWTLVDFCGDGNQCGGSGPAVCPLQENDDDSAEVALPFTFSLYGTDYTTAWVNNNGNLTFDDCLATFTPFAFPSAPNPIVAPFFADVDTRQALGDVWQRFVDSNGDTLIDTFVVTWDNVGYFSIHGDLRNTFQVAISDGTNPVMGIGNNICFSYDDMQWTTGDASGGTGGFGGEPATVGANAGDGVEFFAIGRFDQSGNAPPNPVGGIDWLDGQNFCINATGQNICPIPVNFPPGNQVTVVVPDTLNLNLEFQSPEQNQTTTVTVSDPDGAQAAGLQITNIAGQTATLDLTWNTECQDDGTYVLTFSATDDDPDDPCTTVVSLTIIVDCPNQPPVCDAGGPYSAECTGATTSIPLDGTGSFDPDPNDTITYAWSTDCPNGSFDDPTSATPVLTLDSGCDVNCIVTLVVTDQAGAATTCTADVNVVDTTPPAIVGAFDQTVECDGAGNQAELNAWLANNGGANAQDLCGGVTWSNNYDPANFVPDCGAAGYVDVTFTATDDCGNAASTTARFTIVDTTPPEFTVIPQDAFFESGNFICDDELANWLDSAEATDICGGVTITNDAPACGFPPDSTNVVTWTAEDDCGNTTQVSATVTIAPAGRGGPGEKGSILFYPNVEVRWTADGSTLLQDTFISVSNDFNEDVHVLAYFISEPCTATFNNFVLTHNEPTYWSALTGQPKGLSPITALVDPYPDPDGSGELVIRGALVLWAIDGNHHEIRWNHLYGEASIVHYGENTAWEYQAWAFQTDCVDHGAEPLDCTSFDPDGTCCTAEVIPGNLDFDGFQYDLGPSRLVMNFITSDATAFSGAGTVVTHDTDVTLVTLSQDLRQDNDGPITTKAKFYIWNEEEVSFAQEYCMTKWSQRLFSLLGGHFLVGNLGTNAGRARIDGMGSTVCPDSVDASLLGVANRILDFNGGVVLSGHELHVTGRENARIQFDVLEPPGEAPVIHIGSTPTRAPAAR